MAEKPKKTGGYHPYGNPNAGKTSASHVRKKVGSAVKSEAKRAVKRTVRKKPILLFLLTVLILLAALCKVGCDAGCFTFLSPDSPTVPVDGTLELHMIDVGQGDAILLSEGGRYMLIDTGDRTPESKEKLSDYLEKMGVRTLDWLVLTHPDGDHIGGACDVFKKCTVERVLISDKKHTTTTYRNTIQAIIGSRAEVYIVETDDTLESSANLNATVWRAGMTFVWQNAVFKILGPIETTEMNNNASVVLRMTYGERSVLFTGDMEYKSDDEISDVLRAYYKDLDVDILKAGHHGSYNAVNEEFIRAVSPDVVLISCGADNSYGHPHKEAMRFYENSGATIRRTDLEGTIVYVTDGDVWSKK